MRADDLASGDLPGTSKTAVLQEPMTPTAPSVADLSDEQLIAHVKRLAAAERRATAALNRSLMELDAARRPAIVPLAPERYKVQLTISRETHDKLRRVQALVRHTIPDGDPAEIYDRGLTLLLRELERRRCAATSAPRGSREVTERSRHISAAVRRDVWRRDGGQCAFVGRNGRCIERGFLEFHHVQPYAAGGAATAANIQLRCRAHNVYEAALFFGSELADFAREGRSQYAVSTPGPAMENVATRPG